MRQHICNRTAFDRAKKGCCPVRSRLNFDEVAERDVADSAQATRILKACEGILDVDDMHLVIDMLAKHGKLSGSEAESAKSALSREAVGGALEDATAMDRAFYARRGISMRDGSTRDAMLPNMDRLNHNNGRGEAACEEVGLATPVRAAVIRQSFDEMFPHANRLK